MLMNDGNYRWFEIIGDISRNQNGQLEQFAVMEVDIEGRFIHVTVCIGVAEYHSNDCGIEDVIERSDSALYRAKGHGRNRVEIVSS